MKKFIGLIAAALMLSGISTLAVVADETENDYFFMEDEVTLQKYINKEAEEIIIPDYIEVIGKNAFRDCINLKAITIPSTVKCIEDNAFMNCKSLEAVKMTNSVEVIGDSAFAYCPELKEFVGSVNAFNNGFNGDIFGNYQISDDEIRTKDVKLSFAEYDENTPYIEPDDIYEYPHDTYPVKISSDSVVSIEMPDYILSLPCDAVHCPHLETINLNKVFYAKEGFIAPLSDVTAYISDIHYDGSSTSIKESYKQCIRLGIRVVSDDKSTMLGDVNCDGDIDVRDVTALRQYIVKLIDLDEQQMLSADVTDDEKVDMKDLGQLLKYMIKVIDTFIIYT